MNENINGVLYCFTNKINNKKYVGQTYWEKQRYNQHKNTYEDSVFHRAIKKYGFENFEYEVLLRTNDIDFLNDKEIEYIEKLQTIVPNGYNIDKGGRNNYHERKTKEEWRRNLSFAKGVLTEEEVIKLRELFLLKASPTEIYNQYYSDRITSLQAFMNIWCGKRYSCIMPEVFEGQVGRHTKLTKEKAHQIKELIAEKKLTYREIGEKFGVSRSTIVDIQKGRTWKDA